MAACCQNRRERDPAGLNFMAEFTPLKEEGQRARVGKMSTEAGLLGGPTSCGLLPRNTTGGIRALFACTLHYMEGRSPELSSMNVPGKRPKNL